MTKDRDSRRGRDPLHRGRDERDVITERQNDDSLTPTPAALGKIIAAMRADDALSGPAQDVAEEIANAIVPMLLERIGKSHQITTDRLLTVAQAAPASERTLVRLAELETWRRNADAWRLRLTGAADSNGRLGNLDRTVAKLREDVGDPSECKAVRETTGAIRALQRKAVAAVIAGALSVGASAAGLVYSRDRNIEAAARAAQRIDTIERDLGEFRRVLIRLPFLGAVTTPDPVGEP